MKRARWAALGAAVVLGCAGAACSLIASFDGLVGNDAATADGSTPHDSAAAVDAGCDADLSTSANCGACGHDCFGGACKTGACSAVPIVTGLTGIGCVDVNGTQVAFTFPGDSGAAAGSIYAALTDGGALRALATGERGPFYVRAGADHVYASEFYNGKIRSVTWDGTQLANIATPYLPNDLVVSTRGVVWADQGDGGKNGGVYAVEPTTLAITPLATGQIGPEGIVEYDGGFVFTDFDNGGKSIIRIDATGTTAIATGKSPFAIATDGTYVYWSDRAANMIQRTHILTGATNTLAIAMTGPNSSFIRVDATHVYWTEADLGNVRRVRSDGSGAPELLFSGNGPVSGLAMDDRAIYFGLKEVGNVMKLAK